MLVIKVTLRKGRTLAQKKALGRALTEAAATYLGEARENIRLVYYEVSPDDWFVAGEPLSSLKKPSLPANDETRS